MFCRAVIGALQPGTGRARDDQVERLGRYRDFRVVQLGALAPPLAVQDDGQPVDDDVEKAADQQAEHQAGTDKQPG